MMPGYTITETLRELGIGIARLRKLMLACGIVPVDATNERGKVKIITRDQLVQLRDKLEATTLTVAAVDKPITMLDSTGSTAQGDHEVRIRALEDDVRRLRAILTDRNAIQTRTPVSRAVQRATEANGQNTVGSRSQIGIGKARGAWLAVNHGARSPWSAKGWLCWDVVTLASEATALAAVKAWLEDPRHDSGVWTPCSDATCPCSTM